MALDQITCPHCSQPYAVRPEQWAQYHGRTINCTKCGQGFTVSAPPEALAGAAGAPIPQSLPPTPAAQPVGQPPPAYQPYPVVAPASSGWAVTSLVTGIAGFCVPVLGPIFAIIAALVGISKSSGGRAGGRGMAIAGLVLGICALLFATPLEVIFLASGSLLFPAVTRAREQSRRINCRNNMKRLGGAMIVYANSHRGHFPDKLEQVLQTNMGVLPTDFICPGDDKLPPTSSSLAAEEHEISSGTHCSYIYVGTGATTSDNGSTVIMYEPLSDHHNQGMNVLYADGTVRWLNMAEADPIIRQHAAGVQTIHASPPADEDSSDQ